MENTALVPLAETMQLGEVLARSGFFKDGRDASQAVVKVLAGRELGIGPVASMTGIYIVDGKVSIGANLMAAAVKRSRKYNYRVTQMDGGICSIDFYEGGEKIGTSTFTMQDAQAAGVSGKQVWKQYPKNMLFARAMSNGVRWFCPDIFGGAPVYDPDELGATVNGETGEVIDVTPQAPRIVVEPPTRDPNGFDDLPSASAERAGNNGKSTTPKHNPDAPWDEARKAEAVRWAMRTYPAIFKAWWHAEHSLNNLLEACAAEGKSAAEIAAAWKEKCARKQAELDAQATPTHDELDAQAAAEEAPRF